ncbi:MAG TPA: UDP-N-acetylmuramate:L-alanyl-gamma-D-glutamyl-meso-diaminopimelate ligase [Steroidobacteraceae bacterium]|jgi:UDP-N-acetylmuramate: L-alanyl-gamma-D-glutamyl-meso-diaminopimelate ligase|nr:UDP-N-acetylmuramate:L-alanyl-gamma-D-glutamyl-meso-diaminopimelate ligase [Steroidobacteraceae bacterium]
MTRHIHILGIAGTFMGGVAAIAKAAGFRVTGSDLNVYPPMSTQLQALGIELVQGYGADQLDLQPDVVVVGNALSRGMPVIEAMLDRGLAYTSGPLWLAEEVLHARHVIAVSGTHGKTTTTAMLTWILEQAGLSPGYLVGGVPSNFDSSARLGAAPFFVIEADEYDTAFFDKRAKFVHYRPRTAILNNLEYDHADIYPDVASIRRQFNQLLRTVPGSGRLIVNGHDPELEAALSEGCWTPRESFGLAGGAPSYDWTARIAADSAASRFTVLFKGRTVAEVAWELIGEHNVLNALAAIGAASHAGVPPERAAQALSLFRGVKRRMEVRGVVNGVTVYDDFAHHPTAIETTLKGLRARVGAQRILAVLEPRSNTMKLGVHREQLAPSLDVADKSWFFAPKDLGWDLEGAVSSMGDRVSLARSIDELVQDLIQELRPGDHVLIMSNGGFGGLHDKLLAALRAR